MYSSTTFEHKGETYEVRTCSDGHKIHVRAFKDAKPANGYSYCVEVQDVKDAQIAAASLVNELIKTAQSDVRNGVWEEYVAATNASDKQSGD
jgi:hypothetical protein